MKIKDILLERWTAKTVKDYFDSQENNKVTRKDFTVSYPIDGCILFRFNTVPDLTRAFFRMAEYYEGSLYKGSTPNNIDMADFLDNFVDRKGEVDYFQFWDGFNVTDKSFKAWTAKTEKLAQAEKLVVDVVKQHMKQKRFSIVAVAGNNADTDRHELFHALYYLNKDYQTQVNQLVTEFQKDPDYKIMSKILNSKLDYKKNTDEEIAAYLTAGTQLEMVFGIRPKSWVKKFRDVFESALNNQQEARK
jgi:hypothetical protein